MKNIFKFCLLIIFALSVNYAFSQFQQQELEFGTPQKIDSFTGQRVSHESIVINNYLYVMGGYLWANSKGTVYNDVQFTYLDSGSLNLKWKKTADMNNRRTGLAVTSYNGFIYAIGGSDENFQPLNSIEFAKVNSDGTISEWRTSPNHLNISRSNLSAGVFVSKTGRVYLYAIAGVAQVGNQTIHFPSVEFAEINKDGSISGWTMAPYEMKGGRSAPAGILYKDKLYVFGGWGDILFDDVFSDVQYTEIDSIGLLNPWHTSPFNLRMRSYGHYSVVAEIGKLVYILIVGGTLGQGNTVDFIQYSRLNSETGINTWIIAANRINGRRWGHTAVYNSGNLYVLGGADGNTFMNDVQVISVKQKL